MASAFVDSPPSWFSPRISFSRDFPLNEEPQQQSCTQDEDVIVSSGDFEFRLDAKKMLPADELFSDGKLVPLHLAPPTMTDNHSIEEEKECEDDKGKKIIINEIFDKNSSPKQPKCSSRWKEFLGLKRSQDVQKLPSKNSKSLKFFLRSSKSDSSSSMNLPLLKDIEGESISISSRLSLSSSSSSSCRDHEDLPRLSLDTEKPNLPKLKITKQPKAKSLTSRSSRPSASGRVGRTAVRRASDSSSSSSRGVSVDSPRMNSSGKIVFHSLERSSSSPSSFNGGPRMKARGMERSYSANVRIRPVLNVPICSLRGSSSSKGVSVFGIGQLFSSSSLKRDGGTRNQSIKRNGSGNNR